MALDFNLLNKKGEVKMQKKYFVAIVVGLLFGINTMAHATSISYTAINLPDNNAGEDLWQYAYLVKDRSFSAGTDFTIYFDFTLYDILVPGISSQNMGWDIITWNPDPSLPDDGVYDANAMVDNASLANMFTVNFVWLGNNTNPGPQYFEIYDSATWSILEDGFTGSNATPVPEPATVFLFGIGVTGLLASGVQIRDK